MVVREVFEVLYSPVKAFSKIVEKPDFKGVLLILVLFVFFMAVGQYLYFSKIFLQTRAPDEDNWTELISNQHLWISNGEGLVDSVDKVVGNYSVTSSVMNGTVIGMNLTDIVPLDCSADTGYEELFFWIKWIHPNETFPSSGALRLFSDTESYFELELTDLVSNSSDEWSNATVNDATLKIGPDSQGWTPINSPNWKSVTGLEFKLAWLTSANLTMKIDDLRFQRYVSAIEKGAFSVGAIIGFLISAAVAFSMNWLLWALILLMIAKVFREEGVRGTIFFVIIGHVFIVTVVYTIANAALVSMLPALNVPSKVWPPTIEKEINATSALIEERWYPTWAYQLYTMLNPIFIVFNRLVIFPILREIWTMALCFVAIRLLYGITWGKAISISIVAFIIRFILAVFLF